MIMKGYSLIFNKLRIAGLQSSSRYSAIVLSLNSNRMHSVLTLDTINPNVRLMEYAVRGEIAIKAEQLKERLEKDPKACSFHSVINANIGNPQQVGQKPITFVRQVAALTEWPEVLLNGNAKQMEAVYKLFNKDAVERARKLVKSFGGSTGAYSHSQGSLYVRKSIARFIQERDGYSADPNLIFCTSGASSGIQNIMTLMAQNSNVGFMIPIPQYPLYSATIELLNCKSVPYYLVEEKSWGLSIKNLRKSLKEAKEKGVDVRSLIIINPGNPTGQCLTEQNMEEIIRFCQEEKLVILADEVYQVNAYLEQRPFHSFKKVLKGMGKEFENVELFSFHSISKGVLGECGRRGGYFECTGIDSSVIEQIYKMASVALCPPVQGQIMMELMVNPPKEGDESFPLYYKESKGLYDSLKRRAKYLSSAINKWKRATCQQAQGAMYVFPKINFPDSVKEMAKKEGRSVDDFYALSMLEDTGVCVVPGSGFGQEPGTFHFRTTFLVTEEDGHFEDFVERMTRFHNDFITKYEEE